MYNKSFPVIGGNRICNLCKKEFKVNNFYVDKSKKYGIRPECKDCVDKKLKYQYWNGGKKEKKSIDSKNRRKNDKNWVDNERKKRREWYKKNPEKMKNMNLMASFGITLEQFNQILKSQNYSCAICGCNETNNNKFHVDHDHETGIVRAVLCNYCNCGIGYFRENVSTIKKAVEYILYHKQLKLKIV